MPHNLIVGMTESGKSTLAKIFASEFRKRKITVAVLDPLHDEWDCDFQTADSDEFLAWCKKNKSAMLFIDEGSTAIGRYNPEMEWLATQSRHWGHSSFFICQRGPQLSPNVRDQASKLYLFACSRSDAENFANTWNEPELKNLEKIDKGEFYIVSRFGEMKKGKVDFSKRVVLIDTGKRRGRKIVSNESD